MTVCPEEMGVFELAMIAIAALCAKLEEHFPDVVETWDVGLGGGWIVE